MTADQNGTGSVDEEKILRERITAFCETSGYELSAQANIILKDIVQMKQITGDFYCPCQAQRLPETICVCQPVRDGLVDILGTCFCNLIVSKFTPASFGIRLREYLRDVVDYCDKLRFPGGCY